MDTMSRNNQKWPKSMVTFTGMMQLAKNRQAFTLLEVMIAIAIMAIALTSLFGSQSQSLSLALEAKFNTTAAFLAQEKIAELEAGLLDLDSGEGDFGEDFPGFNWKADVQTGLFNNFPLIEELDPPVQRVDFTVNWEGDQYSMTFTYYMKRNEL